MIGTNIFIINIFNNETNEVNYTKLPNRKRETNAFLKKNLDII